jgi:crotonobetainyl-CoA:carnitine CoA-transferase CaiB-like acyl-CoA transferase
VSGQLPLAGVKVLDFTCNLPGPYATFLLARQGAQVTKVEPPRGDPARHSPELFRRVNAGKQSVRLDLGDPSDVETARTLVAQSDVVVEGFRPGKMAKLGFGPEQCLDLQPSLVYASLSAYGQDGPRRGEPGHDLNAQALSGVLSLGGGAPEGLPLPVADLSSAVDLALRVVTALRTVERTGEGVVLDVAMLDTVSEWAELWGEGIRLDTMARKVLPPATHAAASPFFARLRAEGIHALPHYHCFRCRDGRWLALGIVDEGRFWAALCKELGLRGLSGLPMGARAALGPTLRRVVGLRLRTRSRRHWLQRLERAGVPVTPVHDLQEARAEPQRAGRGIGWPARRTDGSVMEPPTG